MRDILSERYDAVPYRHGSIADTHPARLAAIGRLHGLPTAPPDRCRVLELGCGEGLNLLPLAERLPHSEFIGIDFSAAAIAVAESARAECGVENARFQCADLRTFSPEPGAFDYVIVHGGYSWVPADVRDRLLAICAAALSPSGLAYVSYNTLPGCALPLGVGAFLREEVARIPNPAGQMEHVGSVLQALGASLQGQPGAYTALLRETVADMQQRSPTFLFHDELSPDTTPCTFTAFVGHAGTHGLNYLAEAHYATMHYEHVPTGMRAPLAGLGLDFLRTQQYMDVLFQRWLRNSLLCRTALPSERPIHPAVIAECALGLRLQPVSDGVDLAPGVKLRFTGPTGLTLEFAGSAEKALLAALALAAPARMPYAAAVAAANALLDQCGLPSIQDEPALCDELYRLFSLDALDLLLAGDGSWLRTSAEPAPSSIMRFEARRGTAVTNRWHEPVDLTPEGREWLLNPGTTANPGAIQAGLAV
jgi:SAM-dependent methyltransferase